MIAPAAILPMPAWSWPSLSFISARIRRPSKRKRSLMSLKSLATRSGTEKDDAIRSTVACGSVFGRSVVFV